MDKKPLVLMSSPRSGSEWVFRYMTAVNYKNGYLTRLSSNFFNVSSEEVLDKALILRNMIHDNDYPVFRFHPRKSIQVHDHHIFSILKDYNIIMLSRKDRWRACLSCLIQWQTQWAFAHHFDKNSKNKWDRLSKHKIHISPDFFWYMYYQLRQHDYLETVKDKAYKFFYYEDLSDKKLKEAFPVELTKEEEEKYEEYLLYPFSDANLNYEECIENIDDVREAYEDILHTCRK